MIRFLLLVWVILFVPKDSLGAILPAQYARFSADTNELRDIVHSNQDDFDRATLMQWKINGQILCYASIPVQIKPDPEKMDTILFRPDPESKWDTILCNIRKPLEYRFVYNTCCGGFYLLDVASDKFVQGKVIFSVKNDAQKNYLGTLDDAAMPVTASADTLFPYCRSALYSNIYGVRLSEVEICSDTVNCSAEYYCLMDRNNKEVDDPARFHVIAEKVRLLYMPLDDEPLVVMYDAGTGEIYIR